MKTTLRNSFHNMSIQCRFPNKSYVTIQMNHSGVGGTGRGVTQAAFDQVIGAFDKAHKSRFTNKRFATNGEFMNALNAALASDDGIADPITLAQKIEEFAA